MIIFTNDWLWSRTIQKNDGRSVPLEILLSTLRRLEDAQKLDGASSEPCKNDQSGSDDIDLKVGQKRPFVSLRLVRPSPEDA